MYDKVPFCKGYFVSLYLRFVFHFGNSSLQSTHNILSNVANRQTNATKNIISLSKITVSTIGDLYNNCNVHVNYVYTVNVPGRKTIACPGSFCMANSLVASELHQRSDIKTHLKSPLVLATSAILSGLHLLKTDCTWRRIISKAASSFESTRRTAIE